MARTSRSRSPPTRSRTLTIRTREPSAQNHAITPVAGEFISTQADRCPFPDCTNRYPHQHSTAEGKIAPPIEQVQKAGEAIRERWTDEQRRRIAENEAVLHQLGELEPKVSRLSIQPPLPHGNDLTVKEQNIITHGGATPAQFAATREMLLERQRQDIIDNTSPISPVSPACPSVPQTSHTPRAQGKQIDSLKYDDFPELNAKYGISPAAETSHNPTPTKRSSQKSPAKASDDSKDSGSGPGPSSNTTTEEPFSRSQNGSFLNTNPQCSGPCPIQIPHNQGAYLQQGQIPRVWNKRWVYSDPPRNIWEAWVRIEQGRGSSWDQVEVNGFALSHRWAGP